MPPRTGKDDTLPNKLLMTGHLSNKDASPSLSTLGQVLAEARSLLGKSPERVGSTTGLAGRTIRRLEAGQITRPHTTTLEALAAFYALDAEVLHRLVAWSDRDEASLLAGLQELDPTAPSDLDVGQLAMRAARRGFEGSPTGDAAPLDPELAAITEDFLALDRRRRAHVRLLLRDLRTAVEQERRASSAV